LGVHLHPQLLALTPPELEAALTVITIKQGTDGDVVTKKTNDVDS